MLQQNKIHRIFVNNTIVIGDDIVADKYVSNHIKNVLRIKNNQDIKIFNGDGVEYLSKIQYKDKYLIIQPVEESRRISRDSNKIHLAQCISNSKSMLLYHCDNIFLGLFSKIFESITINFLPILSKYFMILYC